MSYRDLLVMKGLLYESTLEERQAIEAALTALRDLLETHREAGKFALGMLGFELAEKEGL